MFKERVSAAKSLTVVGKLLITLATSTAAADSIERPRFFEYQSNNLPSVAMTLMFGWFQTLNDEENAAYQQSLTYAALSAENGQRVSWYSGRASGYAVPVMTWPTGSGYCRRLHIQATAYNTQKTMAATVCFDNTQDNWQWTVHK